MCFETVKYYTCKCKVVVTNTCYAHIAHTHKQTDNITCPHFQPEETREKFFTHRCSLRTGTILDDGSIFYHGSRKPRLEFKFEVDPNYSDKLLGGRRATGGGYEGDLVPDPVGSDETSSQTRPPIKQEQPIETKINTEYLPQSRPSWLNPSAFYNTEPYSSQLPPAYTPTSSRLLMPYDPDAESSSFGQCSDIVDENAWGKSMIKKEDREKNEDPDMGGTDNRKGVKGKWGNSAELGALASGKFYRNMGREFVAMKKLLRKGEEERKKTRNEDTDGDGDESDDVDMK